MPPALVSKEKRAARLFLTPNQLYYLLSRFSELDVALGPMNVRTEHIHAQSPGASYVSFLARDMSSHPKNHDQDSIRTVSSVRSVISGVSMLWNNLNFITNPEARAEKQRMLLMKDITYLFSAFTKVPCLKLSRDSHIPRIRDYEEFPLDTAVPINIFKNLSNLEISDLDFRSIYGWDRLSEQLQSLKVTRADLDDAADLLIHIVLDDMEQKRRRSSRSPSTPSYAGIGFDSAFSASIDQIKFPSPPQSYGFKTLAGDAAGDEDTQIAISESPYGYLQEFGRNRSPSKRLSDRRARKSGRPLSKDTSVSQTDFPQLPPKVDIPQKRCSISGLLASSKWRFLRRLSLAENGLTSISEYGLAPLTDSLQSLDLSSNLFTEIPSSLACLQNLKAINMSNCMIESLRSLNDMTLPSLSVLNLSANRLSCLVGMERLTSLERVDLRSNQLKDPAEMGSLRLISKVQEIFVEDNPFVESFPKYRIMIFGLFRNTADRAEDVRIDSSGPSQSERRQIPEQGSASVIESLAATSLTESSLLDAPAAVPEETLPEVRHELNRPGNDSLPGGQDTSERSGTDMKSSGTGTETPGASGEAKSADKEPRGSSFEQAGFIPQTQGGLSSLGGVRAIQV